jgi:hypothetical protein
MRNVIWECNGRESVRQCCERKLKNGIAGNNRVARNNGIAGDVACKSRVIRVQRDVVKVEHKIGHALNGKRRHATGQLLLLRKDGRADDAIKNGKDGFCGNEVDRQIELQCCKCGR